jgi:hypothetical protein
MFVLTDDENAAALATYAADGAATREDRLVMFTWEPPPRATDASEPAGADDAPEEPHSEPG